MGKPWTPEEEQYLKDNHKKQTYSQIGIHLNRSTCAISRMVTSLCLSKIKKRNPIKIGEKIGKLTVISESSKKSSNKRFVCLCECENTIDTLGVSLRSKRTASCGCLRPRFHRKEAGYASFMDLFGTCKKGCKRGKNRVLSFELNFEQFKEIISQDCSYCGQKPKKYNKYINLDGTRRDTSVSKEWAEQCWVLANGVDRIDSDIGYTIDNVVPCCKVCNTAKSEMTLQEWNEWLERIAQFRIKKMEESSQK